LGASYTHPQYVYRSVEARSFLAGSLVFNLDEIKVYQIEKSSRSLLTRKHWSDLNRICQLNDKWRLIYKASQKISTKNVIINLSHCHCLKLKRQILYLAHMQAFHGTRQANINQIQAHFYLV
jgi:hypothetical protein